MSRPIRRGETESPEIRLKVQLAAYNRFMSASSGIRPKLKGNVEEALRLFSSETEWDGLNVDETEFVLEETLKCYGSTFDGEMIRELFKFYRRYLGLASVGRRQQLLTRMTTFISNGHQNRSIALLCFISADSDGQITSGASLDLAMVMTPEKGDPLTGPKFVAFHGCGGARAKIGKPADDDEGDVAAGLLLLGDMRLLPLLEEIWNRLTPGARHRMIRRRSNLVSALVIEFLLRRLEADVAEEYHGELGAALHNLPDIAAQLPMAAVMDIRRNFGLPSGKEPMELLGRETLAEAFTRTRPRLKALVDRESEPKVLNNVLAKWADALGEPEPDQPKEDLGSAVDEEDEEDEYPEVCSQELHDEFEEMSQGDEFVDISEDIYFWKNPYKTKALTADDVKHEFTATPVFPLLVTGIFNPFGPTVNVYLVQRDDLDEWKMVLLRLNPFSCTKADLGKLNPERVSLEPGVLDEARCVECKSFAMAGRSAEALDGAHDYVLRIVLGRSRLQGSFTLCHSTTAIDPDKTRKRVAAAYRGTKNGRDDLNDLRDKQKLTNPWARADMAEAVRRMREPQSETMPLTRAESAELAGLVLEPTQQRIEMLNLLQAWEGAVEHSGLTPLLTREQLLNCLVFLTPDMPNLINLQGPINGDKEGNPSPREKKEEKRLSSPDYRGPLGILEKVAIWEVYLIIVGFVWALVCAQWLLAVLIFFFFFIHSFRIAMMGIRQPFSRWLAVINFGLLGSYAWYRFVRPDAWYVESPGSLLLFKLITGWAAVMFLVNLGFYTYAQRMKEAPNKPD